MTAWRLVSEIALFCSKFVAVPTSKEIERIYRRTMNVATIEPAPLAAPVVPAPIATEKTAAETVPDMVAFWDVE
jgi:hypothetical protein